jgi:hypothetical protein
MSKGRFAFMSNEAPCMAISAVGATLQATLSTSRQRRRFVSPRAGAARSNIVLGGYWDVFRIGLPYFPERYYQ